MPKDWKEKMTEKKKTATENTEISEIEVTEELLREKLYEIRGVKVMIDADVFSLMTLYPW